MIHELRYELGIVNSNRLSFSIETPPISKRPSKPFRISIEGTNVQVNENDFDLLIKDVYNLAGANWRGFNAKAKPITIYYSQLVAEFMNHLFHNKELCLTKDLHLDENTPWFI